MPTGLVLSGGGMRGAAHIGVIKALEEHDIKINEVSGVSAGAIVGSLFAGGMKWKDILRFFKSVNVTDYKKFAFGKPGFINTDKYFKTLQGIFPDDDFGALKIPLYINATNIISGENKTFSSGKLIKPILASAAFPGVYTPVEIDGNHYVDGGVLNNFPVEVLKENNDKIIGVYVNPFGDLDIKKLKYSYSVLERAYRIKSAKEDIAKFQDCDLVVCPDQLNNFGIFDSSKVDKIFEFGYAKAQELLTKDLLKQLKS
ncbi:patatin-like phospholipase family protein [Paucihalobacter ruber]|uniref:Patatin-like phospholipase family protein n=1 Tax=Paucihalobacter ruber TaxID=2567861 RepID=A0A506PMN2_9FLAO|nr:patatin-like phospholipase family protein [Paucihalobacter ruber]TPV33490.1 patatin-like phospholipase family protein [Paucihalobacter ruber]